MYDALTSQVTLLPYLVVAAKEGMGRNGKPFMTVTLRSLKLAERQAKAWDSQRDLFPLFQPGKVLDLHVKADSHNGSETFVIQAGRPSDVPPTRFLRQTHLDVEATFAGLRARIAAMTEPLTRHVAEALMARPDVAALYRAAPAASKVHNNWRGGLLEHVHSLCGLADGVIPHYEALYGVPLSRDKVIFGLLFHDAGKVVEYDADDPGFRTAPLGLLTPHIVLGPAWVYEASRSFPEPAALPGFELELAHLMHILAAHHGQIEYGSPVKPASLEALLVHQLDTLDSKLLHAFELVRRGPGDAPGFSEKSWVEQTRFLLPPTKWDWPGLP